MCDQNGQPCLLSTFIRQCGDYLISSIALALYLLLIVIVAPCIFLTCHSFLHAHVATCCDMSWHDMSWQRAYARLSALALGGGVGCESAERPFIAQCP